MKISLFSVRRAAPCVLAVGLLGCGGDANDDRASADRGRDETRSIRATEKIGYSGDAIADKLDSALDANDSRAADLDRRMQEADAQ